METVEITENEEGAIHVRLQGSFELCIDGNVPFYKRLLIVFLRLLDDPGTNRPGWKTRDGRTPAISQRQIAVALHISQSTISRLSGWWHDQNWRCLLGQKSPDVNRLTTQETSEYIRERYGVSIRPAGVTEWLRQGRLKGEQIGGWQWIVDPADIAAAMGNAESRKLRAFLEGLPGNALDALSEKEQMVLLMYAGIRCLPTTLEAIGRVLGVTREYVRQVKEAAVKKLENSV